MGISKIFPEHEILFAEWMVSRELNEVVETEYMLSMESSSNPQLSPDVIAKVERAKTSLSDLKDRVADLALHEIRLWTEEDKKLLQDIFRVFSLSLEQLALIQHDSLKPLLKDLTAITGTLRRELCYSQHAKQNMLRKIPPKFTLLEIKKVLNETKGQIEHLNTQFSAHVPIEAFIFEEENPTFTSEVEHVAKRAEKGFRVYADHLGVSQFEASSKPTPYYLINGWLIVSAVPSGQQNPASSPVEFKTGDEPILLQLVGEGEQLPPDQSLRLKIIQSIDAWGKLQIKKMRNIMLTSLIGAGISGSFVLIRYRPEAPLVARVLYFFVLFFFFFLGAASVIAGIDIHRFYLLRERVSCIKDLGGWVKQLRTYIRKYPILAHRYTAVQKFLTPKELAWVRSQIKPVIKA